MTELRKAEAGYELLQIQSALERMLVYSPAPQMKLAQPEVAYRHLKQSQAEGKLYVLGDLAILVDVAVPWYTTKPVLMEDIIVRFRKEFGTMVEDAIAALEGIAREHGCVAVAAGDTQIGYMAPRYTAAGFETLGTQFYKEIP